MKIKTIRNIGIIICLAVLLEVFVFNFLYWKTKGYKPVEIPMEQITSESESAIKEEGMILADIQSGNAAIGIPLSGKAKTIAIQTMLPAQELSDEAFLSAFSIKHTTLVRIHDDNICNVRYWLLDAEGNILANDYKIVSVKEVPYILIPSRVGAVQALVSFGAEGEIIQEEDFRIVKVLENGKRVFVFSIPRCLMVFFTIGFFYAVRKKSRLWEVPMQKAKALLFILPAFVLILALLWESKNDFWWEGSCFVDSYKELTEAFAKGETSVALVPSEALMNMENPYDYNLRTEGGVDYYLDYAYFEGKYYVYFGALPALIELPYYKLTGKMIPYPVLFNTALFLLLMGIAFCLMAYGKRYHKEISVCEYALLYLLWVVLSYIPLLYFSGFNYTLPQIFSVMFAVWGIYFYMEAGRVEGNAVGRIIFGSLCMALIVACRPQIVLCALLAFPLLKEKMIKKKTIKMWLAFVVPFVVVAIPIMLYNYARFGSVFDFGVSYNLTYGNVYDSKLTVNSFVEAIKFYLFTNWHFMKIFPFMQLYEPTVAVPGCTVIGLAMGYLWTFPVAIFSALYWPYKGKSKSEKEKLWLQALCIGLTIVMIAVATIYYSFRYAFDFSFLLGFATVIAFANYMQKKKRKKKMGILLAFLIVWCGIVSFFTVLTPNLDTQSMFYYNRDFWFEMSRLFTFWLY